MKQRKKKGKKLQRRNQSSGLELPEQVHETVVKLLYVAHLWDCDMCRTIVTAHLGNFMPSKPPRAK